MKTDNTGGEIILCISTRERGHAFLRELAHLGCRVVLLTVDEQRNADWPHEILHEFHTMPGGMTRKQIANTVMYLARTRKFARTFALDESDMETAAALREHIRLPGMGVTTTRYFRDRLAMRAKAAHLGIRVPAFTSVWNYDNLRDYMESVPAPWLFGPRKDALRIGIQTLHEPEQVWRALDELGDRQSYFLLEQLIPGEMFSIEGIVADGKMVFTAAHRCGETPALDSKEDRELKATHAKLISQMGLVRGVTHTKFLRSRASGKVYFLETSVHPGDAPTVEAVEQKDGINLWVEWARVEVAAIRGEAYKHPKRSDRPYGGGPGSDCLIN